MTNAYPGGCETVSWGGVPMTDISTSRLVAWLKRKKGEELRVVGRYDSTEVEWLYRRDDVHSTYTVDDFAASVDAYRGLVPAVESLTDTLQAGDHRATVNVYDQLVLLLYVLDPERGVVVSFDTPVGEDMVEIVTDGLQLLLADQDDREAEPPASAESMFE